MPAYKDRYEADNSSSNCGHPNVVPMQLSDGNGGKETHAVCGNDDRPGCGEEWPK